MLIQMDKYFTTRNRHLRSLYGRKEKAVKFRLSSWSHVSTVASGVSISGD